MNHSSSQLLISQRLWETRLARIKKDTLVKEWSEKLSLETKQARTISQAEIIDKIIKRTCTYDKDLNFFKSFVQKHALTGREACYLFYFPVVQELFLWIDSWSDGKFPGQKYTYAFHQKLEFNLEYFPSEEPPKTSYPSTAIFLVAYSKVPKLVVNGLELTPMYETSEVVLVLRKDSSMVEFRGQYTVVQDFTATLYTSILSWLASQKTLNCKSLRPIESYLIGNREMLWSARPTPIRQIIKIEELRVALKGYYKTIHGLIPGSVVSQCQFNVERFQDINEESYVPVREVLEKVIENPIKGIIGFLYQNKEYSFYITKTGGIELKQYMPEEVLTMIIHQINKISRKIES